MTKIEVEIKSKDMIKPVYETPNHLKTLQFSLIDQISPPTHTPYIFYYQTPLSHNNNSQTTTILLKNSLSETLVQFYPLAGRIQGNLSINCNDDGVEFYEADVFTSLAKVIANPDPEELIRLLPFAPLCTNKSIVAAIQVNHFSCGGMAISVSISHKIADAATGAAFVNAWALNARRVSNNIDQTKLVTFDSASLFPPMDLNGILDHEDLICKEKVVTRRLIFDEEKLDELKKQCDDGRLESPATRVAVVCAFVWKKLINIAKVKPSHHNIFHAWQSVNLRTIKESPIPENYHGNLFWPTFTHTSIEPETKYSEAVGKLRTAVKMIDPSYLLKIKTGESLLDFPKVDDDICEFSSWIRFPFYEVDFGWGTPTWVSTTTVPYKNSIGLLSTKCGRGIEAWIHVLEQDAAALDEDDEFRSLTSHIIQA